MVELKLDWKKKSGTFFKGSAEVWLVLVVLLDSTPNLVEEEVCSCGECCYWDRKLNLYSTQDSNCGLTQRCWSIPFQYRCTRAVNDRRTCGDISCLHLLWLGLNGWPVPPLCCPLIILSRLRCKKPWGFQASKRFARFPSLNNVSALNMPGHFKTFLQFKGAVWPVLTHVITLVATATYMFVLVSPFKHFKNYPITS